MLKTLLNLESKSISSAAVLLAGSALVSRILGIVRDRLLASRFGAGEELDAYFAAFRIPDLLYAFLVLWGLSAVFLPLFSEYMAKDKEKAWRFVNHVMNTYIAFLFAGASLAFLLMPRLVSLIAPGFEGTQFETAVLLSRIMLISPLFFALSAVSAGVLQYFQRFVAYAAAPMLYNLGIITGIVFFTPLFGIVGVALGVVMGAIAHFLIQVPSLISTGFSFKLELSLSDPQVRKALILSLPRTIAGVAHQFNLIIMVAFASLLPIGSITIFTFAENMYYFPVGVVGVPLATAAFPLLSRAGASFDRKGFFSILFSTLKRAILVSFPLALLLFFFKDPLFRIVFLLGEFTSSDARLSASVFGVFTFGIVFQACIPSLVRGFFALQNTITPTIIGVSAVALNIALVSLFLSFGWGIFALPWALVLSGMFQCLGLSLLLFFAIRQKTYARKDS